MASLKELSKKPEVLTVGHRLCAGCGAPIAIKQVLMASDKPVIVGFATGCVEVATTIYPFTAWRCPWIHNAFENVCATVSGVETAYRALKKKGKIADEINFVAFGGDGGMYDIGLQSLSGALERGHRMLSVCYDNQAYMNCLSLSTLIMTKEGLKKITEIKEGDEIYAFDQKTQQLVLKKCSGIFDNGIKDVYELFTLHHSIKATSNHPFLIVKKDDGEEKGIIACQTKTKVYAWKTLEQIKVGDEVVVLKNLNNGFETEQVISIKYIGKEPTLDLRVEEEHNFIANGVVVHNTGIQRSSATPKGAATTTTPAGKVMQGKQQFRKDLAAVVAAHKIPYVATACPSYWNDLITKAKKAFSVDGPSFMNILAPCPRGWRFKESQTVEVGKLAVETCFWPLYEVENGTTWRITYTPKQIRPLSDWTSMQGRFAHLNTQQNKHILDELQEQVKKDWEELLRKSEKAASQP